MQSGIVQRFGAIHKIEEREFFEGTPLVLPGESLRIPVSEACCLRMAAMVK